MPISNDTLRAMVRDYHLFDLSDEELELVLPELEAYLGEAERLRQTDLSGVLSGRLLRVEEGGGAGASE